MMFKTFNLNKIKILFIFTLFFLLNYRIYADSSKIEDGIFYSQNDFFVFQIPPIFNKNHVHFLENFMDNLLNNDILKNYYLATIYDNFNSIQIELFKLLKPIEKIDDSIANIILKYQRSHFNNSKIISAVTFENSYIFFLDLENNDIPEDLIVGYIIYKFKNFVVCMNMVYPKKGTVYYFNGKNEKTPIYDENTMNEIIGILTTSLLTYKENIN